MKNDKIKNVDEYILAQPERWIQKQLIQIRKAIRKAVPNAEEVISYQVPCYKLNGMMLAFGARKGGSSLYAIGTNVLNEFKKELKIYTIKGSTIHFNKEDKIPIELISKIATYKAGAGNRKTGYENLG